MGQRQVPRNDGAVQGLPRSPLLRVLRRLRLAAEVPGGDAARLRPDHGAVHRLADADRAGDAPRAHGAARRERAEGGRVPGGAPGRGVRRLPRPARPIATTRSRANTCPRARAPSSPSGSGAAARPAGGSSSRSSCSATLPTSATRSRWSSTPPRPRTSSSPTTSCGRPASARAGPGLDRHREHRRHPVGPGPGARGLAGRDRRSGSAKRAAAVTRSSPRRSARPTSREPTMTAVGERNGLGLTKAERYRILTSYRTIAMVGLSTNYYNASSFAGHLPGRQRLRHRSGQPDASRPGDPGPSGLCQPGGRGRRASSPIEIVDVFRPAGEVPQIAVRRSRSAPRCCGCSSA